jgi:PIN domain nuclease of toxin-antitoxin system
MSKTDAPSDSARPLLLDTHVLIWLIEGAPALGRQAKTAIDEASREESVLISAITPWEMGVLIRKNRPALNRDLLEWVRSALELPACDSQI